MPRRNPNEVVVDPVAAAELLEVKPGVTELPPVAEQTMASGNQALCGLGHVNAAAARFCADCGLPMGAPAPAKAEVVRPKPAAELTDEERAARERQHLEALAAARQFEAQQPVYAKTEGEAVLIHFVDDGFTFAGQVWYRGQELEIGPGHPRWEQVTGWIMLTKFQQIERYGKQFFDHGPWPGRRSYLDAAGSFEKLSTEDKKGTFSGPGEQALRQADEAERRRGRAVPAPLG